jgi:hypothetical protein
MEHHPHHQMGLVDHYYPYGTDPSAQYEEESTSNNSTLLGHSLHPVSSWAHPHSPSATSPGADPRPLMGPHRYSQELAAQQEEQMQRVRQHHPGGSISSNSSTSAEEAALLDMQESAAPYHPPYGFQLQEPPLRSRDLRLPSVQERVDGLHPSLSRATERPQQGAHPQPAHYLPALAGTQPAAALPSPPATNGLYIPSPHGHHPHHQPHQGYFELGPASPVGPTPSVHQQQQLHHLQQHHHHHHAHLPHHAYMPFAPSPELHMGHTPPRLLSLE